jgi:hypothetical protein
MSKCHSRNNRISRKNMLSTKPSQKSQHTRHASPLMWGIKRRLVFLVWVLVPLWLAVWLVFE